MWAQIRWLHQEQTDLGLHGLLKGLLKFKAIQQTKKLMTFDVTGTLWIVYYNHQHPIHSNVCF